MTSIREQVLACKFAQGYFSGDPNQNLQRTLGDAAETLKGLDWRNDLQSALNNTPSDVLITLQFQTPEVGEGENITLLREMFKIALDSKKNYH